MKGQEIVSSYVRKIFFWPISHSCIFVLSSIGIDWGCVSQDVVSSCKEHCSEIIVLRLLFIHKPKLMYVFMN